jgi:hypothetical protein
MIRHFGDSSEQLQPGDFPDFQPIQNGHAIAH